MLLNSNNKLISSIELKDKKIIMYGASTRNKAAIKALGITENILFFVDSNEDKVGKKMDNYPIRSVSCLSDYTDCIVLTVLVSAYAEVLKNLQQNGIKDCLFYYPEFFNVGDVFSSNRDVLQRNRQYRYIHVFSNDKFVIPFYQMLKKYFVMEEHLIILAYRIKDDFAGILPYLMEECKQYHNVLVLDDVHGSINNHFTDKNRLIPNELDCNREFYTDRMKGLYNHANKIILHSAFWGRETKKFVYALTQCYAPKMVWGCFGGDAYFDKDSFEVKEVISKIGSSVLSSGLYDVVEKNYNICGKINNTLFYIYIPESAIKKAPVHESTHILLGHAAFEHVNHIAGLQLLKKFADEDIKIYCPLSYGVDDYRNDVIRKGKALFGDKFIPVLHYMEQEQYYQFLQTIDVAVFPTKRLAAESTIILLKAFGVKIYTDINVMEYMQDTLAHFESITKIENSSFDEFSTYLQKDACKADDVNKFIADSWSNFLDSL